MERISKDIARSFLVNYQGLNGNCKLKGAEGVLDYFQKVRCVQYDPLDVVGRNADLVLQSRITNYHSEVLQDLLYKDRALYDAADKMISIVPTEDYLNERENYLKDYSDIWAIIHRGQYPELYENKEKEWEDFYSSYVSTYIERDVTEYISIKNTLEFVKFMTCIAARTGNILVYSRIASEVGVDEKTISMWVDVLVRSDIIYLLKPYANSHLNRITKKPKIYFKDTGLAA